MTLWIDVNDRLPFELSYDVATGKYVLETRLVVQGSEKTIRSAVNVTNRELKFLKKRTIEEQKAKDLTAKMQTGLDSGCRTHKDGD